MALNKAIRAVEVIDNRKKLVVIPGLGATERSLETVLNDECLNLNEITLRIEDKAFIQKYSVTGRYEGAKRVGLERYLFEQGWRQWRFDSNIWLKPGHKCFNERKQTVTGNKDE